MRAVGLRTVPIREKKINENMRKMPSRLKQFNEVCPVVVCRLFAHRVMTYWLPQLSPIGASKTKRSI